MFINGSSFFDINWIQQHFVKFHQRVIINFFSYLCILYFRELYQKVINLEQGQCQNEIKISHLTTQIENLQFEKEEILSKSHNGEFLWRIRDFTSYHQKLRNNHSFVIYSKGFYTSFYGYKVCMRSNLYISEGL